MPSDKKARNKIRDAVYDFSETLPVAIAVYRYSAPDTLHLAYINREFERAHRVKKRSVLNLPFEETWLNETGTAIKSDALSVMKAGDAFEYENIPWHMGKAIAVGRLSMRQIDETHLGVMFVKENDPDRAIVREGIGVAFENASLAIVMLKMNGDIVRVNKALAKLTGYLPEELIAMRWSDLISPDAVDESARIFNHMAEDRMDSYSGMRSLRARDGKTIFALTHKTLIRDESEKPLYILMFVEDATNRALIYEEELLQRKLTAVTFEFDELISRLSPDYLCAPMLRFIREKTNAPSAAIIRINAAQTRYFSYESGLSSKTVKDEPRYICDAEAFSRYALEVGGARYRYDIKETKTPSPIDAVLIEKGLRSEYTVLLKAENQTIGALTVFSQKENDIPYETRRIAQLLAPRIALAIRTAMHHESIKAREMELAESRMRLLQTYEMIPYPLAVFLTEEDGRCRFVVVNEQFAALLGVSAEETVGLYLEEFIIEEDADRIGEYILRMLREQLQDEREFETTLLNGRTFRIRSHYYSLPDANRKYAHLVCILREAAEISVEDPLR